MGLTPIPAKTGAIGIDLFLKERPDLVLLDIIMPDLDGYDVARQIRQLEPPGDWTPIIFLSSLNKDNDIEMGIAAGGDDYLLKPISEVVLASKIRAMQRIVQMRQSLLVLTRKLDAANQELKRLTSLDGLTGIANRRHFDEVLTREWRRAMRQGDELSIIMCDIDFFKLFNDTYGHQDGDECLRQIAQVLVKSMDRGGDLLARYGGEEFVAVLPGTSLSGASFVAGQMRQAVEELAIAHNGSPYGIVTTSFGVASALALHETDPLDVLGAADRALYEAKHAGRNRVSRMAPSVLLNS
jgi:diguanylate cyclase (GGDEF)-like protein